MARSIGRRRWRGLSVRGLMVLVLVVGLPVGWKARRASLQRRGVAAVRGMDGSVAYDWQPWEDGPAGPGWLRRLVGDDYFQDVARVDLPIWREPPQAAPVGSPVDPERARRVVRERRADRLEWLDGFGRIESLDVDGMGPRGPEALARIGRASGLKWLRLSGFGPDEAATVGRLGNLEGLVIRGRARDGPGAGLAPVGPPVPIDLAFLDRLPRLVSFTLYHVPPTGEADLARIARLGRLEDLALPALADGAGLAPLVALKALRFLDISSCPGLTDAGLAPVAALRTLHSLILPDAPRLTDAGLASLAGLPILEYLDLSGTPLEGPGLDRLAGLPRLRCLRIARARVDPGDVARLQVAMPGLKIELRGPAAPPALAPGDPQGRSVRQDDRYRAK